MNHTSSDSAVASDHCCAIRSPTPPDGLLSRRPAPSFRKGLTVWSHTQGVYPDRSAIAEMLGMPEDQVRVVHVEGSGCYGHNNADDASADAALLAAAMPGTPIQVIWTREDDMRAGRYRPAYVHQLKAGLDAAGNIVGWYNHIVGQSIVAGTPFAAGLVLMGVDVTSVEGAAKLPYSFPSMRVELTTTQVGVPVLWWRAVGSTHTAYAVEAFLDELEHAAGKDPVEYRRTLLKDHPRHLAALNLAAEKAGWSSPSPEGRGRGIAVHESFGSYVAQVAEVSVEDGQIRVHRVVCAIDCGVAVNPLMIAAQMESGIVYGLGAALFGRIRFKDGRVQESNFHDYRVLRLDQMPVVETHVVPSTERPGGVGEPGTPPIAPAVANALFALTGQRLRELPLRLGA